MEFHSSRICAALVALAVLIFVVVGAPIPSDPESVRMLFGRDDEQSEGACGHGCIIGIVGGIIVLLCVAIVLSCVWSSRKRPS
jgi:hypothetical protein